MSALPVGPRSEFVEWCEAQAPVFVAQEAEIGLTKAQVVEFAEAADKARSLIVLQERAQQAALVATQQARAGVARLHAVAGSALRSIRAYAETTESPDAVYSAARIPPPAAPTPIAPPDRPTRLSATLDATTGALTLRWKARQPKRRGGATYLIRRRLPGESEFTFVGSAGKKTFVDDTLPAGLTQAEYTIQAQRARRTSPPSAILTVTFGAVAKRQNLQTPKSQNLPGESLRAEMRGAAVRA